jgi:uncharacterized OsmC-like protein
MRNQRLRFPGSGGRTVAARLDLPADAEPTAFAVLADCLPRTPDADPAGVLVAALNQAGLAVLRLGGDAEEGGEGEEGGASDGVPRVPDEDEVVAAADLLAERHAAPALLVGHSLAGVAVLRAAARIPAVVAVATLGAPFGERSAAPPLEELEPGPDGTAEVALAEHRVRLRGEALAAMDAERLAETARSLHRALLVLHAPRDMVVGVESAAALFQAARHPKSFLALEGADHLLSDPRDARHAGSVIAAWAGRYLPAPERPVAPGLQSHQRVAARIGRDHFRTGIRAGGHGLAADEPASLGGTDSAPTPFDLLAAALGSCTAITLRMYADRKGWPLESAVVHVKHSRITPPEGAEGRDRPNRMDRLEMEIELCGELDDAQRARLLEIADRCPVHRTLEAGADVETRPLPRPES